MLLIKRLVSRQWIGATIVAIIAAGVMIRLGIWQLDRLEQRKAFNAQVIQEVEQEQFKLSANNLSLDLTGMEYRKVSVQGRYDFLQEVALRNQVWNDQIGVHLLTPLIISGTNQAVIIDRGWIPQESYLSGDWSEYWETGEVMVEGVIRQAQSQADLGRMSDPVPAKSERLVSWNLANIPQIAEQIPYQVLPVYIQQSPGEEWVQFPYRSVAIPELSEGSHMSYAIQWFSFALILTVGYPIMVSKGKKDK
jgi:surfeit locus 1 family protein